MAEEFSHTVLHGENIKKNIQALNKPAPRISPSPRPSSAATPVLIGNVPQQQQPGKPVYDPSKVYKTPLVRRPPSPGVLKLQNSYEKKNSNQQIRKRPATPVAPRAVAASNESVDLVC